MVWMRKQEWRPMILSGIVGNGSSGFLYWVLVTTVENSLVRDIGIVVVLLTASVLLPLAVMRFGLMTPSTAKAIAPHHGAVADGIREARLLRMLVEAEGSSVKLHAQILDALEWARSVRSRLPTDAADRFGPEDRIAALGGMPFAFNKQRLLEEIDLRVKCLVSLRELA